MSTDPILKGQVVDTPTAQEFTRLALERVGEHDFGEVAELLEAKAGLLRRLLDPTRIEELGDGEALVVLKSVFSSRRKAKLILESLSTVGLAAVVADLLWGSAPVGDRLGAFADVIASVGRGVPPSIGYDLGSELLHFTDPDRHWLWTRWMWNPDTGTGALPLVVMEEVDLDGGSIPETYMRIGVAMTFLNDVGEAAGFRLTAGMFGTDIFLASVYGVYMYTTLRMRMTQEFNKIIPDLDELVRRLLGVNRLPALLEVAS